MNLHLAMFVRAAEQREDRTDATTMRQISVEQTSRAGLRQSPQKMMENDKEHRAKGEHRAFSNQTQSI